MDGTAIRLLTALAAAIIMLLVAALAATANAATINPTPLPNDFWTNSVYTFHAYVSEPAPADIGARLSLDCGPAVTVTPPTGFCLEIEQSSFPFTLRTFANVSDAACSYTLHQDSAFYDPLPAQSTDPRPVRTQRSLIVTPASTAQSPILVGRNGVAPLNFAPSEDLIGLQRVNFKCSNLAIISESATGVQLAADPRVGTVTMGDSLGLVACSFSLQQSYAMAELDPSGWAFFQIVEPVALTTTGIPLAASVVAGDLPAAVTAGTYTLSIAPPSTPHAFGLYLACALSTGGSATVGSVTFTTETTTAQTMELTTPAAPADGASVIVTCTWSGSGAASAIKNVLKPSDFTFYLGSDVAVSASAAPTQLTAATPTSVITVSVPDGTVFANSLRVSVQCSAGSLSSSTLILQNGQLSATTTYTSAPTAAASAPQCTFAVQSLGDYRRVKAAIAPVTFNVAAAVPRHQLVVKGLPTAADTIAVTAVPGIVSQAAATAGIPITLSALTGMAAGSSVTGGLSCTASFGSVVAVTPAQRTFTPESTGPAEFVVNVTAPTQANARSTLVECSWEVDRAASTQSEVDRLDAPQNFNFFVGRAVQLVAVPKPDSYSFDYVPENARVPFTIQSAANEAALVGGNFRLEASCTPCAGAGLHTGEGYLSNSEWTVYTEAFPLSTEFRGSVKGVVTCHWTFPAGFAYSRAFLPPVPTVFTVVPRALLPVMGMPTASDVIPLVWGANVYPGFRRAGEQVTITIPAAPADFSFGSTWVNFTLNCYNSASESTVDMVSNGGRFDYSGANRGAKSVVITMPNVTDDRPLQVECVFESAGLAPLAVAEDDYLGHPSFLLLVATGMSSVTMLEPSASPLVGGSSLNVWFEPSRTIQMPGTRLVISVKCAFSVALPAGDSFSVQRLGVGRTSLQAANSLKYEFLFTTSSYTSTLTANATDPAMRLGYKIVAPRTPMTVTCAHDVMPSDSNNGAYADRFIRMAPMQPIVVTVVPQLAITVTGVPTEPLAATPAQQTITVQPVLRAATDFPAGETVSVTLRCPGLTLPNNGLLTFTSTGEATVAAQSIVFTPPTPVAGAGNVWQCSWVKLGTVGDRFPLPEPFKIVVGSPVTWSVDRPDASKPIYPSSGGQVFKGVITPSSCLPSQGYLYSICDSGVALNFLASGWEGASFIDENYLTVMTAFEYWIQAEAPGTYTCRFTVENMQNGAGVVAPPSVNFTVLPRATFTVTGQPAVDVPLTLASGGSNTFTIAPTVAPATGGVTVRLICDDRRVTTNPPRVYFPAGLVAAQSIVLTVPQGVAYVRTTCYWRPMEVTGDCGNNYYGCEWSSYDRNHFEGPAPFQLSTGAPQTITVGGLNAQGSVVSADVCTDLSFTVAPTVAPAAGTSVVLAVRCPQFNTQQFTFTAEAPQAQTVTLKSVGTPLTSECVVSEQQGQYVQQRVQVTFGTPSAVTVTMPTFVARGGTAPFELTSAVAVPFGSFYVNFYPRCSYGWMSPVSMPNGATTVATTYYTSGSPPRDDRRVADALTPQPLSVDEAAAKDSEVTQSLNKGSFLKERRSQHQRAGRVAAIAIGVADTPASSDATTGDQTVTCSWNMEGSISQRFTMTTPTSSFIVGTPANLTVSAVPASVTQGASAALTITPSATVAVDVAVSVVCPAGITPSPAGFNLLAGSAAGQLITFAVAADAQLGAAQCTLASTGPGRFAVTTASPIALNVVEASMGGASSSSTGKGPCVDVECGAFASASLPGLAALAAMMLATFAQRQ